MNGELHFEMLLVAFAVFVVARPADGDCAKELV